MSSKAKIGLLLAVHVIAGLLSFWYANTHSMSSGFPNVFIGLFALVYAQAGLIGIWCGLSTSRLAWRLLATAATAVYLSAALFISNRMGGKLAAFLHIALIVVPILVCLISLRLSRLNLQLARLNGLVVSKRFQFTIRHVLLATAIVAVVLGFGRVARIIANKNTVAMMIYPPCFIMVELATLWATLGLCRPALRLAFVVPAACVVGTIPMYYLGPVTFEWLSMFWSAVFGLQAIITAASLLVVRSCGLRLVSGATSAAMPVPEPTRRFRFTLKQLFLLVTLVGIGFGTWSWLTRKVVVIRAARPEDEELFADYMEEDEQEDMEGVKSTDLNHKRNVVVATGKFMRGTWLLVSQNIVQAGIVEQADEQWVGRDEASTGGSIWEEWNFGMSLGELNLLGGQKRTELTISDPTLEFDIDYPAEFDDVTHNINVVATETLPATITPGRPHIVYVEGDQAINVDGKMTVEEFAKANPGNYLVVTVEIR